jgi:chorismate-pyruvate lyase
MIATAILAGSMTFRIETAARGKLSVLILSGRFETPALAELRKLLETHAGRRDVVLDLKDVNLVGREVVAFLAKCEADGVKLENCTPYLREWMEREKE